MSIENGREAQESSTTGKAVHPKSRFGVTQVSLGAVSLALCVYAIWNIAPMLPVVGPMISKITEPTNLLEKTADIGKSKKADFAKFVDAGGLDTFQSWHGLAVSNINTAYSDDGNLSQLTLLIGGTAKWSPSLSKWTMDSTSAPPALVRSVLAKFCGSDNWQITGVGGRTSKTLSNGELICSYNKWNDRSNDMVATLELSAVQAVSPPPETKSTAATDQQRAPELPNFQPREPYSSVREKLIAGGWQMFIAPDADACANDDERCQNRPEMQACSGSGVASCRFLWKKETLVVAVITAGETKPMFMSAEQDATYSAPASSTVKQGETSSANTGTSNPSPVPSQPKQEVSGATTVSAQTAALVLGKWECTIPTKRDQPYGTLDFMKDGKFTYIPGLPDLTGKRQQSNGDYAIDEQKIQTTNLDSGTRIEWTIVTSSKTELVMANQYRLVIGCDKKSSFFN